MYTVEHWSNFVPIFLLAIKIIALVVCGFFAIKWHFDEERRVQEKRLESENEDMNKKYSEID